METYRHMLKRHQSEFNQFPCFFAFNQSQFEDGKKHLGVVEDDELYCGTGGMYYRRVDAKKLYEMVERNCRELNEALHNDDDFLYEAVRYELANHEYCITEEWYETLESLNLDEKEVFSNERMKKICLKAMDDYMSNCKNE